VLDPWHDHFISPDIFPNMKPYPIGKTIGLVATFQINKPQYEWQITDFKIENPENLVIYEMLIRDFTNERSLEAAIEKLDYLKLLGVTAVQLMPIQEFGGNISWGYNPSHFFATDKAYGTPEMYKRFIDECHKRGMAVILDKVFNHATGDHPFARLYWDGATNRTTLENPWFNVEAPHPWSVYHDFNHEFPKTRQHFKEVMQYWIREFKVDGFRMDLTKGFTQKQSTEPETSRFDQSRVDILMDYYSAVLEVDTDFMFILEHFTEDREERVLAEAGMYLWRNLNHAFGQAVMGVQSGSSFAGLNPNPRRWVGYAESHDEERNFYRAKMQGRGNLQTDSVARLARVPLQTAFVVLVPGPKMIWQFGEFGYDIHINYNGRTGMKPVPWSWLENEERQRAFVQSAKSINLRKQFPTAFSDGTFTFNITQSHWNDGRRISLSHSDLEMITIGNFRVDEDIEVAPQFTKPGVWHELISGAVLNIENIDTMLMILPGKLYIFTDRKIELPEELHRFENPDEFVDRRPAVPFINSVVKDRINIITKSTIEKVIVYDASGKKIMEDTSGAIEIDASMLTNGMYIVSVWSSSGVKRQKIIKM
jgi:1,4-alpha-glucan branching enzyme